MTPGVLAPSCCTTPAAMCFWAAVFVVIYGAPACSSGQRGRRFNRSATH